MFICDFTFIKNVFDVFSYNKVQFNIFLTAFHILEHELDLPLKRRSRFSLRERKKNH